MRKILCAVAVTTLAGISLAQAVPSVQEMQKDVLGYENATGQAGIIDVVAPAVVPDVKGTPVRWDHHRRRRGGREGTCILRSGRYETWDHARANEYRHVRNWRLQGYHIIESRIVNHRGDYFVEALVRGRDCR